MKSAIAFILFGTLSLSPTFAQPPAGAGNRPAPSTTEVKAYLSLTDAQLTSLATIRTNFGTASESLRTQIRTAQQALMTAIHNNADATTIATLTQNLKTLQTQLDTLAAQYQTQAVNVLTADQKTKLKALSDAAALMPSIHEAGYLMLLTPSTPIGGPRGGNFFRGMPPMDM